MGKDYLTITLVLEILGNKSHLDWHVLHPSPLSAYPSPLSLSINVKDGDQLTMNSYALCVNIQAGPACLH